MYDHIKIHRLRSHRNGLIIDHNHQKYVEMQIEYNPATNSISYSLNNERIKNMHTNKLEAAKIREQFILFAVIGSLQM